MVDSTLPSRVQLIKLLKNIQVFDRFINQTTPDDINTPDGGVVSPLQAIASIIKLINSGKLPASTLYDTNFQQTQDIINNLLSTNKADVSSVYAKTETLSTAEIKSLYPDINNFLQTVKQQVADWLTDQSDTTLSQVLEAVVVSGLAKGTIGTNLILNVPNRDAMLKLQVWDGRTVYVDGDWIYVYSASASSWIKQSVLASTITDLTLNIYTKKQVDDLIANAAPKGTKLSDYNIADAYTKDQTQALINSTISSVISATTTIQIPDLAPMAATSINVAVPNLTTQMKPLLALSGNVVGCMVSVSVVGSGLACVSFFNYSSAVVSLGSQSVTVTALDTLINITPNLTYVSGTASYAEITLAPYANYSYTLTINGLTPAQQVTVNLATASAGLFITPTISQNNTVIVNVFNPTSNNITLGAGTAYVGATIQKS